MLKVDKYSYGYEKIVIHKNGSDKADLYIGKFCSIAECTVFLGLNHEIKRITTYPFGIIHTDIFKCDINNHMPNVNTNGNVIIGHDVWIGKGSTIMSGVRVGNGAVIGANSHVVTDVPSYSVVVGNPAKVVFYRFEDIIIKRLNELKWWDWSEEKINNNIDLLCTDKLLEYIVDDEWFNINKKNN